MWILGSLVCALSLTAYAGIFFDDEVDIVGSYHCTGHDPYTPREFQSDLIIQKTGEVYAITEATKDKRSDLAIGLLSGDVLSLAYQDKYNPKRAGVQSLMIKDSGDELSGPWAQLGKTTVGSEICHRVKAESNPSNANS
jgi:hypothetical protein